MCSKCLNDSKFYIYWKWPYLCCRHVCLTPLNFGIRTNTWLSIYIISLLWIISIKLLFNRIIICLHFKFIQPHRNWTSQHGLKMVYPFSGVYRNWINGLHWVLSLDFFRFGEHNFKLNGIFKWNIHSNKLKR